MYAKAWCAVPALLDTLPCAAEPKEVNQEVPTRVEFDTGHLRGVVGARLNGSPVPFVRFNGILLDATLTMGVHVAESGLSLPAPLVGGQEIPSCGFCIVLLDAAAADIQPGHAELPTGVTLFGTKLQPG